MSSTRILADGLSFTEGPRWHEGKLWFSDMYAEVVYSVTLNGELKKEPTVPGRPSGLGWMPNGDLLVVSIASQGHALGRQSPDRTRRFVPLCQCRL